jgi:hypothetical protein
MLAVGVLQPVPHPMKRLGLPVLVCLLIGACVFSRKQMNPSPQAAAPF